MKIEIRSKNQAVIEGYVNVVERESRTLKREFGTFIETVKAGAFQKAINQGNNVELRFNHQRKLGDTKSKTLLLHEDAIGLYAKAYVSDEETIEKAKNKELRGWSFGFFKKADKWTEGEDGVKRRTLEDFELTDVSIIDKTPAYVATTIEMRGEVDEIVEFRMYDDNVEIVTSEERSEEETSQPDLSIFYAKKQIEILKAKGANQNEI